jgi:molybdopterin-containing oxidoreductase family iron-sulfur binding subunit
MVPGEPMQFATALPLAGFARGVICTAHEGRPTKISGNPRHLASLGATDVFAEAAVLSLYDPDRSKTVRRRGTISSWDAFLAALQPQLAHHRADGGAGLRVVTGRIASPTLARQIAALRQAFPQAQVVAYDPTDDPAAAEGARLAYGRAVTTLPRLGEADLVVTFDADPLGPGPAQIRNARAFAGNRRARAGTRQFGRLYAIEAAPTLTGANADHRLALAPDAIGAAAVALAARLGAGVTAPALPAAAERFVRAVADDLLNRTGRALVLAGATQPAEVHALAHWINHRLQAPIDRVAPPDTAPEGTLADLVRDMEGGRVETLFILGANPAYDAPADLGFEAALAQVPFSAHLGAYVDETAALCGWHIPQSHPLEAWSDLRAVDGAAAIAQPLIRPLYASRDPHQLLAALLGENDAKAYDLVRETWAGHGAGDFDGWWRRVLHDGVVPDSAPPALALDPPKLPPAIAVPPSIPGAMTLLFRPDPSVWDGSRANNAWLQECPKPLTKEVWGNSLALSPADAATAGVTDGDLVEVTLDGRTLEIPLKVTPGVPAGVAALSLGYGRRRAGAIGTGVGANAYAVRTSAAPWAAPGANLRPLGRRQPLVTTQQHFALDGDAHDLMPLKDLAAIAAATPAPQPVVETDASLYPAVDYDRAAWGMVIDTSACIGCNACVVACQSENNVPVIGPKEIERGRDMHWLRIDAYDLGTEGAPRPAFQPVPCMQCEKAPCEPVCPVAASVHDSEGLNLQVYNRCVGTRFCEANCPYKVRRFNFFGYADGQAYANLGQHPLEAQRNPEVSVRARGVMEKCTYCVQRISHARRAAEKEDRDIRDGEVVTACQSACPTEAIHFGDLNRPEAAVTALRREPHHYALLAHLGTRPRTTYLARIRNPNPALAEDAT